LLKITYVWLAANQVTLEFWQNFALNILVAVPLSWFLSMVVFALIVKYFVDKADRPLAGLKY